MTRSPTQPSAHLPAGGSPNASWRIAPGDAWSGAWKVAAVVALIGALGAMFGYRVDAQRFAFSYLFAFAVVWTLALGSLFFVLIQHLTASGWSVGVRRSAEFVLGGMSILPLLFLPLLLCLGTLYEWVDAHHHAVDAGHSAIETALHHRLLAHKSSFLNLPFFLLRTCCYFVIWLALAALYRRWSFRQDESGDAALTVRMAKGSPLALALFGLSLTFAAIDWLMSLEPTWYSTIFGVYVFASSVVSALALLIVLTMALKARGYLDDAVTVEHYHDLGKLMFGFTCFWAYIAVSQMLLIWYAGIPEEATYYHRRWDTAGWRAVSLTLILGHFCLPFLFMISRVTKRRLPWLRFAAGWMLFMHAVDMYWFVMPYASKHGLQLHWLDIACLLFTLGAFFAVVFRRMLGVSLVPVGDPRLARALHFHNA